MRIFFTLSRINDDINYILFFRVETIDGSAVEGEDYEPVNEILTFEPREREKEVGIWLILS
jgi:hypothetical protein